MPRHAEAWTLPIGSSAARRAESAGAGATLPVLPKPPFTERDKDHPPQDWRPCRQHAPRAGPCGRVELASVMAGEPGAGDRLGVDRVGRAARQTGQAWARRATHSKNSRHRSPHKTPGTGCSSTCQRQTTNRLGNRTGPGEGPLSRPTATKGQQEESMRESVVRTESQREFWTDERCFILELSNSPDDEGASVARARVEPGITTALHRLNGVDERYIMIEGRGRVEVGGLSPTDVSPGDVVLIPRGTPQRISNTGKDDLVFLCVCTPRFRPECYEDLED